MSYVDDSLIPNEIVILRGAIHWSVYASGMSVVGLGVIVALGYLPVGGLLIAVGMMMLVVAWWRASSIELAVTNLRVIAKVGRIRRDSLELLHNKVESLQVDQTLIGRLFNFGSIVIHGTGGSNQVIPHIAAPMAFRKAALGAIVAVPPT
jgi:uncharacterized membrane protein YdbT with pleckstrin-like domain